MRWSCRREGYDDPWRYYPGYDSSFDDDYRRQRDAYGEELDRRSLHSEQSAHSIHSSHSHHSRRSSFSSRSQQVCLCVCVWFVPFGIIQPIAFQPILSYSWVRFECRDCVSEPVRV